MVKVSEVIVCRKKIKNGYVVLFAEGKPVIGLERKSINTWLFEALSASSIIKTMGRGVVLHSKLMWENNSLKLMVAFI